MKETAQRQWVGVPFVFWFGQGWQSCRIGEQEGSFIKELTKFLSSLPVRGGHHGVLYFSYIDFFFFFNLCRYS